MKNKTDNLNRIIYIILVIYYIKRMIKYLAKGVDNNTYLYIQYIYI